MQMHRIKAMKEAVGSLCIVSVHAMHVGPSSQTTTSQISYVKALLLSLFKRIHVLTDWYQSYLTKALVQIASLLFIIKPFAIQLWDQSRSGRSN